jgi:hypothetical protein
MTKGLRAGTAALFAAGILSLGTAPGLASSPGSTQNPGTSGANVELRLNDLVFGVATPVDQETFVLTEANGEDVVVRVNSATEFEQGANSETIGDGVLVAVLGRWTRSGDFEALLVVFPDDTATGGSTPGGSDHEAPAPGQLLPGAPGAPTS